MSSQYSYLTTQYLSARKTLDHAACGVHLLHALHHLLHLVKLLDESVHLLYRIAATFSQTLTATAIEQIGFLALRWSHREDDRFNFFERIVVNVHVFQRLAHTRYHTQQVFHIAHLLDLGQLIEKVIKVE